VCLCHRLTSDAIKQSSKCETIDHQILQSICITYLAKTSALKTQPMMLPRCGTLLTYGNALVTSRLCSPATGNLKHIDTSIVTALTNKRKYGKQKCGTQFSCTAEDLVLRHMFLDLWGSMHSWGPASVIHVPRSPGFYAQLRTWCCGICTVHCTYRQQPTTEFISC